MKSYEATCQSDLDHWEGKVEASRPDVAVHRAAERMRIGHWATVKIRLIGTVKFRHVLIFNEKNEQDGSTQWVEQGLGIKHAIRELRIPKVTHVATTNMLAPFCFYGIRGHYTNGDADVFIVDRGSDLIPVCSDFTEKVSA